MNPRRWGRPGPVALAAVLVGGLGCGGVADSPAPPTTVVDSGGEPPLDSAAPDPPPVEHCTGGSPATGAHGYVADVRPILDVRCASCHTSSSNGGFSVPRTADGLVARAARGHAELPLIDPGLPEGSYLWRKLTNTHGEEGGDGDWMPRGGQRLDADECAIIEAWIAGGAAP